VEWQNDTGLFRATIPVKKLVDGQADPAILEAGIPYGLPWEELEFSAPTGAELAQALRAAGIWTKQDLFSRPKVAVGVLQSLYSVDLGKLIEFATKEQ
jgi:hypothetical protein